MHNSIILEVPYSDQAGKDQFRQYDGDDAQQYHFVHAYVYIWCDDEYQQFSRRNLIYNINHPSQFVLILFCERIVVQPKLEIDETH